MQKLKDTATRHTNEDILIRYKNLIAAVDEVDECNTSGAELNAEQIDEELADGNSITKIEISSKISGMRNLLCTFYNSSTFTFPKY